MEETSCRLISGVPYIFARQRNSQKTQKLLGYVHLKTEESVDEAMDEQGWVEKSQEILGDIKEWRQAHPKATFVEIEDEVHKRMMQLEAQVLQEAVQASSNREWRGKPTEEHPRCPKCQVPLKARGTPQRT